MYRRRRSRRWYRPSLGVWLLRSQSEIGISKLDYNEPRTYRVVTLLHRVREHIICSDIKANGTHDSFIKRKNGFHFCYFFFDLALTEGKTTKAMRTCRKMNRLKKIEKTIFLLLPRQSRVLFCAHLRLSRTQQTCYIGVYSTRYRTAQVGNEKQSRSTTRAYDLNDARPRNPTDVYHATKLPRSLFLFSKRVDTYWCGNIDSYAVAVTKQNVGQKRVQG